MGGGREIFALQKQPQLLAEKHGVWNNQKRLKFILLHYFNNQEQLFCAIETVTSWAEKGNIFFFVSWLFHHIIMWKTWWGRKRNKKASQFFRCRFFGEKESFSIYFQNCIEKKWTLEIALWFFFCWMWIFEQSQQ